jgi:nucleotide-binding universal stress UspA family protein
MERSIKIVLATDCSEAVMNAERYAVQFASSIGARLTVMHVFESPLASSIPIFDPDKIDYDPGRLELRKVRERMNQLILAMGALAEGLDYECVVREGNVVEEILQEAKESEADLLITGTHDTGKFRELFLGSLTWEIMKKTELPVLAIPEDALYEPIRQLVFTTEYREEEIPVIRSMVELARYFDAALAILHVTNDSLSKPVEAILFEKFKNELADLVSYDKMKISLIHDEDLVTGLNDFCLNRQADWLAICSGKSNLSDKLFNPGPSLTRRMSFHTRLPLLVFPDNYQEAEWGFLELVEKSKRKHN